MPGGGVGAQVSCVTLVTGEIAKLDLTTDVGRAEFAMALAAQNAGKPLSIYQIRWGCISPRFSAIDKAIWQYAKDHGFTIVTLDSDLHELVTLIVTLRGASKAHSEKLFCCTIDPPAWPKTVAYCP